MSNNFNLHNIFRVLVNNKDFLTNYKKEGETDSVGEKIFVSFPEKLQRIVPSECYKIEVTSISNSNIPINKAVNIPVNISFLTSLQELINPPSVDNIYIDKNAMIYDFYQCISHKISGNHRIDRVKNSQKVKKENEEKLNKLIIGAIDNDLIVTILNICEINLLVYDYDSDELKFYWSHGHVFPTVNLWRDLFIMVIKNSYYEPIIYKSKSIDNSQIYSNILLDDVVFYPPIQMGTPAFIAINNWNISYKIRNEIIDKYFAIDELD